MIDRVDVLTLLEVVSCPASINVLVEGQRRKTNKAASTNRTCETISKSSSIPSASPLPFTDRNTKSRSVDPVFSLRTY